MYTHGDVRTIASPRSRGLFRALATAALAALVGLIGIQAAKAADMVVYKTPTCGCCDKWIEHMEQAGFTVDARDLQNLNPIKAQLGIAGKLQSCHTATVGGYVVEGHVPADVVQRLLDEQPAIHGIAVPGMPMGSPGMEGPYTERYNVLAIGRDGRVEIYERR
ncbi:CopG family transcriptional regulator [Thioalkalivibrio denitrificans]|uniref:CopG family transcriptional regulator n=1 Tax=Thioalkalivibrio denitrificans TaxID=108003 RepID=A0A1V3N7Q8_9GAMM|nr:DUF411 domain-containing protein [Thioalkalivibrio denitrificans]OOG21003.1 CopG family transcriptional regulator [Thioalkalivibrio denitrificans]